MKNYVKINGVSSQTITGLAINELPPITKPLQRNIKEEIDGRDGDIITKLGYSAYDKTITISLFGSYNADDVIKFFNKEGTIIFSNEDDKVYSFTMLNEFDIERILKFGSGSITFHCQPFKYPLTETPKVVEYEYVTAEDVESATLNQTIQGGLSISLKGNTSQYTTTGKNKLAPVLSIDGTNINQARCNVTLSDDEFTFVASGTDMYFGNIIASGNAYQKSFGYLIDIPNNATNVYLKTTNTDFISNYVCFYDTNKNSLGFNQITTSIAIPNNAKYCNFRIGKNNAVSGTTYKTKVMASFETITDYEPYTGGIPSPNPSYPQPINVVSGDNTITISNSDNTQSQTIPINLPVGTELCKIGTYQDYFMKNSGKNLFDESVAINNCSVSNGFITITSNTTDVYIQGAYVYSEANKFLTLPSGNYYLKSTNSNVRITLYGDNGSLDTTNSQPITLASETNFGGIRIRSSSSLQNVSFGIMLSTEDTMFEPYGTGQWCKYNAIGKVDLANYTYTRYVIQEFSIDRLTTTGIPNIKYTSVNTELGNGLAEKYLNHTGSGMSGIGAKNHFAIDTAMFQVTIDTGENPSGIFYYALKTPYLSLIEDNNLIEQLEDIKSATSYEGQTNVGQENNDKPFLLDLSAIKEGTDTITINNTGNIYSKPILALEGTGIVDIYLNGNQILQVDMTENNKINIDIDKLEAYDPDTSNLTNRKVTGDISKFILNSGNNTIKFSGALTKATITKYTRWL